ncbi:zinc/cadmium resistance protein isoform X2 [Melanotaenia boesemani]|uniref:zinc/cadmium resistance protein isoform X2 n=1 Tax=Melanotaenia boesemani TaxID=1250792 RepID=UPI001C040B72|nr:zinc/cadmium resistance protein isoform X2 [Melanotaenia boesemani]
MNDIFSDFTAQITSRSNLILAEGHPFLWVAGMRVLYWCMLVVTMLLLLCEIVISQLCKSLITMVDGFYTLFILMHMALPHPQSASIISTPVSSLGSPPSPPHASLSLAALPRSLRADSPVKPIPGTQTVPGGSDTSDQSNHETPSLVNSHKLSSPTMSPKTQNCGLSFTNSRIQSVGVFISALLLASLCISYFLEIISFILKPHPVQHPVLLVVVGAVSVLHKMLVFGLNWDQLKGERTMSGKQEVTESYFEVNHKVLPEADSRGQEESKDIVQSNAQSASHNFFLNRALVFSNPGTSSIPDTDSKTLQQLPEVSCEEASNIAGFPDHKNTFKTSSICKFSALIETPAPSNKWPVCPLSFILVIRGLFTSLLALINSLMTLLIAPQLLHSSGTCSILVYLDPGLSLLAVVTLVATAVPQVYRYGLLLLQASPPHICVSDLGRRIASVPGVQAVHDLHVWQLTESLIVASVHVHCYTGFPVHRCADVMAGVTKVLHNVGVSCCTVQPEFASCSGSPSGSEGNASPVIHREYLSSPPLPACSLACGKACAGSMCCSLLEEDTQSVLTPPAGELKEDPQTLVFENTFL